MLQESIVLSLTSMSFVFAFLCLLFVLTKTSSFVVNKFFLQQQEITQTKVDDDKQINHLHIKIIKKAISLHIK